MCHFGEAKGYNFFSGAEESLFLEEALGRSHLQVLQVCPWAAQASGWNTSTEQKQMTRSREEVQVCVLHNLVFDTENSILLSWGMPTQGKLRVCLDIAGLAFWMGCSEKSVQAGQDVVSLFSWHSGGFLPEGLLSSSWHHPLWGLLKSSCHLGLFCVFFLSQGRSRWKLWVSSLFRYSILRTQWLL